ncbi:serine/threonine-protein kinase [Streptomyces sp. NPDC005017]|uniref:serine/threonine-protein kinase n=1 Tax=Streptomyces sp. NPDC005017 TaxID=3364706 RepID=UPI0036C76304
MQGQLIAARYRLAESIGRGGMGRVWRAHDEVLHRTVAIKELTAALYVSESDQAVLLARTRAEARAAARINHSAVVTVHDVLEHDGRPWIVMELVEGRSLADAVKEEGRIPPAEAARIGLWVLRALGAAHTAGVLHRDVKPGNVLLGREGRVLLTDFGIAQIEGDATITLAGEVVGSVEYLAPERVRGHDPGPASDLWALGATLYNAVEGRSPFRRTSPISTMQAVVEEEADAPANAGALAPVIAALLRKDPASRPSAAEAERMLAEVARGRPSAVPQPYVPTQAVPRDGVGGASPTSTTTPYPRQSDGPSPSAPRRPRRRRTLALVVVLAALVGGGAVGIQQWQDRGQQQAGDRTPGDRTPGGRSPSPSPSDSAGPPESAGTLPEGWERRNDPFGFSIAVPGPEWRRTVYDEATGQVDYSPDGGENFFRIAVDRRPDYDDPYEHQLGLEPQVQRLAQYKRLMLEKITYRDRPGALWEYTWTALANANTLPGPRRAIDHMYISRDGVEYAVYASAPVADWPAMRERFDILLRSWRTTGS